MPHVPHSGKPNGKTRDSRLVREMPARREREREIARASGAEERIIIGEGGGGRGIWREETRYALVKNDDDNDDRGPINYWLRAYLA